MAQRVRNPQPVILRKVLSIMDTRWSASSKDTALSDAERVLEAMVAEYGIEAAVYALDNQGFKGDAMRYLLNPLYEEAIRRRQGF
jgi:hypothetical protein